MLKKLNRRYFEQIVMIIIFVGIAGYYFYFTYPITLSDVIIKEQVKKIEISIYSYGSQSEKPSQALVFEKKQDLQKILDILDNYRYSRNFKYRTPYVSDPYSTDSLINIFIYYLNSDNQLICQYMYVDFQNNVVITNKSELNISYKIYGKSKDLYEKLWAWLWTNK